jgi:hypothetical protein
LSFGFERSSWLIDDFGGCEYCLLSFLALLALLGSFAAD